MIDAEVIAEHRKRMAVITAHYGGNRELAKDAVLQRARTLRVSIKIAAMYVANDIEAVIATSGVGDVVDREDREATRRHEHDRR